MILDGEPPRPDLGWGTLHLDLGWGTPSPLSRPGMGYPLPASVDRLKILPSHYPSDAGGNNAKISQRVTLALYTGERY